MEEHPKAAMYRRLHEAAADGDFSKLIDALADDVVWHQIGGETLYGKQAVADSWSAYEGEMEFGIEVHDVVGNDRHVVGLISATVGSGDSAFTYRTAEIVHVNDDMKATERWAFSDDTAAITEFFSQFG